MEKRITDYLSAGYSGLFVTSHEETRVEATLANVVARLSKASGDAGEFSLYTWSVTQGVMRVGNGREKKFESTDEPLAMLDLFLDRKQVGERSVFLLRDFHIFVEDRNPVVWRKLKDAISIAKTQSKALVVLGCRIALPPELEKEFTLIEFGLPDRAYLRENVLIPVLDSVGVDIKKLPDEAGILSAAMGLTTLEAENAFALSIVERGAVHRDVVYREKCQAVKKNGLLEIVESPITLADIGGLDNLKSWLLERREAFGEEAKKYHLPAPKGFLAVGQPGTGKSLTAKACRSVFGLPLIRLDAAKLFGSHVGESEANWRAAHATTKAMAPCILWIDEVDGAFSGGGSSGATDGGTTARVIKSILQDMQENSQDIIYVMTANDIDNLPAPLLRRLDEVWNVELPDAVEREAIWGIQIRKAKRDPEKFALAKLAEATEGFSGAEIEKLMSQSLYAAFAKKREPVDADIHKLLEDFMPLSVTAADDISKRRERLKGVARLASRTAEKSGASGKASRKIAGAGDRPVNSFKG